MYMLKPICIAMSFTFQEHLVEKRMLKPNEEHALLDDLEFPPKLQWLKLIYETKLQQYDHSCLTNAAEMLDKCEIQYGLGNSLDLMAGVAEQMYYKNDFRKSYHLSKRIIDHVRTPSCTKHSRNIRRIHTTTLYCRSTSAVWYM